MIMVSPIHSAGALTKPSVQYEQKLQTTRQLLKTAINQWHRITQASSLGAEDMVITHLIEALQLPISVFVLQTGALHAETLALLERLQASSPLDIRVFTPRTESVLNFVRHPGQQSIFSSVEHRKQCCAIRKLEPLQRALAGHDAWITGLRQEQSENRAQVNLIDSTDPNLVKLNVLAQWTWGDVWHYINSHALDVNPLHNQHMPSIGCAPCTRAISPGEPFRSGRWWWEQDQQKECGLHA
jgi:phosphoadenosine phosphosulfate reductase